MPQIEVFWKNVNNRAEFRSFLKTSILRPSEAFFGHGEENKKVLGLNFTPEKSLDEYYRSI